MVARPPAPQINGRRRRRPERPTWSQFELHAAAACTSRPSRRCRMGQVATARTRLAVGAADLRRCGSLSRASAARAAGGRGHATASPSRPSCRSRSRPASASTARRSPTCSATSTRATAAQRPRRQPASPASRHAARARRSIRPARSCWSATATRARSTSGRSAISAKPVNLFISSAARHLHAAAAPLGHAGRHHRHPRQGAAAGARLDQRSVRAPPARQPQPRPRAEGDAGGDGLRPRADRHPRRRGQPPDPALGRSALLADPASTKAAACIGEKLPPAQRQQPEHGAGRAGVRPRSSRRSGARRSRSRTTTCARARAPTSS